jgi:hypothetical protein
MWDPGTGRLEPISEEDHNRAAAGEPLADGRKPGPVFRVGEVLEIKGARFRIAAIGRKRLTLEGLPGVHPLEAAVERVSAGAP